MNTLLTNDFLDISDLRKKIYNEIITLLCSNHSMNTDALMKWIGIIKVFHIL